MADSFGKKDREKKKQQKKKEKAERKAQRQSEESKGDQFVYINADGFMQDTPPDPDEKFVVNAEDLVLGIPKKEDIEEDPIRLGTVNFFNHDKGFGFIVDAGNKDSIFVHLEGLIDDINDNNRVVFEVKKGPKGPMAFNVQLKDNYDKKMLEAKAKADAAKAAAGEAEGTEAAEDNTEGEKTDAEKAEGTEKNADAEEKADDTEQDSEA